MLEALQFHVAKYSLDFVFISESLISKASAERILVSMAFDGYFVADPVGRSGGLVLFWKNKVNVSIGSFTSSHVEAIIRNEDGNEWRFVGFYGNPETSLRKHS